MLPGDEVESSILEDIIGDPMIGPGLQKDGTIFIAYKAGPLKRKAANSKVLWVDNVQKRVRLFVFDFDFEFECF